ncbi:unnamed protein product [Effrenium voratum]|nr:unnamed protein product [Effrenium voratum]
MELSELVHFKRLLLAFCDYSGIAYKIDALTGKVFQRWVIADGDGNEPKPFKAEWATIKGDFIWVGSIGFEWYGTSGEILHRNAEWVKVIDSNGWIRNLDWHPVYQAIRTATNTTLPGFLWHEAVEWEPVRRLWLMLPRFASNSSKYTPGLEHQDTTNMLIIADESFVNIEVKRLDHHEPGYGFTSIRRLPGSRHLFMVLRVKETAESQHTQAAIVDLEGNFYTDPPYIQASSLEGIDGQHTALRDLERQRLEKLMGQLRREVEPSAKAGRFQPPKRPERERPKRVVVAKPEERSPTRRWPGCCVPANASRLKLQRCGPSLWSTAWSNMLRCWRIAGFRAALWRLSAAPHLSFWSRRACRTRPDGVCSWLYRGTLTLRSGQCRKKAKVPEVPNGAASGDCQLAGTGVEASAHAWRLAPYPCRIPMRPWATTAQSQPVPSRRWLRWRRARKRQRQLPSQRSGARHHRPAPVLVLAQRRARPRAAATNATANSTFPAPCAWRRARGLALPALRSSAPTPAWTTSDRRWWLKADVPASSGSSARPSAKAPSLTRPLCMRSPIGDDSRGG